MSLQLLAHNLRQLNSRPSGIILTLSCNRSSCIDFPFPDRIFLPVVTLFRSSELSLRYPNSRQMTSVGGFKYIHKSSQAFPLNICGSVHHA